RELTGSNKILRQHHRDTLLSANNLGLALRKRCEAEVIYQHTLISAEKMFRSDY
ncbi:hypothetical protein L873DRAFT_1886865, partial [Choiromyces venosus 120613-1]